MPKKIHKPEEVVAKLRQVEVLVSPGRTTADAFFARRGPGCAPPKQGRLWRNDDSCVRLPARAPRSRVVLRFRRGRTQDGRKVTTLTIVDEFTRECLAIRVARKLKAVDAIDVLSDLFILRGVPGHVRSDNGPSSSPPGRAGLDQGCRRSGPGAAVCAAAGVARGGAKTAYIAPGSTWENGYVESFNARLRGELPDGEIFYSLQEAQLIESWRRHYYTVRPHGFIGYSPPTPQVFVPAFAAWPAAQPRPAPPAMLTLAPRPTLN